MAFTKVTAAGIGTTQPLELTGVNLTGVVTATGLYVTGISTFTGNVSIAGTLTYEDVTNVDAVGLITARAGIEFGTRPGLGASISDIGNAVFAGVVTATSYYGDGSNLTGITQIVTGDTSVQTVDTGSDGTIKFNTDGSERARITNEGHILAGTSAVRKDFFNFSSAYGPRFLSELSGNSDGLRISYAAVRNVDSVDSGFLAFGKSRGTSNGSVTVVQSGDALGEITFQGADGSELVEAASIKVEVDGTPGANDMPGRILFKTTADGATGATERMRISANGDINIDSGAFYFDAVNNRFGVGTASPVYPLDVSGGAIGMGEGQALTWHNGSGSNAAQIFADSGDTLYFRNTSGNTERMRIDSSGRLLVGTTSGTSAQVIITNGLQVTGNASDANTSRATLDYSGSTTRLISHFSTGSEIAFFTNSSGSGASERARIDSSGRLLIGTSSSRGNFFNTTGLDPRVQIEGTDGLGGIYSAIGNFNGAGGEAQLFLCKSRGTTVGSNTIVQNNDGIGAIQFQGSDGSEFIQAAEIKAWVDGTPGANDMPGRLTFSTTPDGAAGPTERVRITAAGQTLFNTSSTIASGVQNVQIGSGDLDVGIRIKVLSDGNWGLAFQNAANTNVGYIAINNASVTYASASDYRLKENVTTLADGIARLQQLKPSRFNFTSDPNTIFDGFLAHEVQDVVPEAIAGEKDAVDDKGNPIYQGIDQSKLVPLLTAALQEAIAKIETLETTNTTQAATIASLDARLTALEGGN